MRGVSEYSESAASKSTGGNVRHLPDRGTSEPATDRVDRDWFVKLVKDLYPKDAGFALHVLTGFEERTCYRYASGETKPSGYFLRALLRTDHGWQVLAHAMDGVDLVWWRDVKRGRAYANAIDPIKFGE